MIDEEGDLSHYHSMQIDEEYFRSVERSHWAPQVPGFKQLLVNVPREWPIMHFDEDPAVREFVFGDFNLAYMKGRGIKELCKDEDLEEFPKTLTPNLRMLALYYHLAVVTFNIGDHTRRFRVIPSADLHWYGQQVKLDLRDIETFKVLRKHA